MKGQGILSDLFWSRVAVINDESSCWVWTGTVNGNGYGMLKFCHSLVFTHRLAFEFKNGPIPAGMYVCHTCDNPPCCRPSHLFAGGAGDNNRDASKKGRYIGRSAPNRPKGEQQPHSKLTDEKVRQIRALYAAGDTTYTKLAERFSVSISLIKSVVKRENWKHV